VKPGRRLVEHGADSCSDADLLAILVGSGNPGRSAEMIAADILERHGSLAALMGKSLSDIASVPGIGSVKAIRLAAAYEIARRLLKDLEQNG
jgi:DNA repair protein RadC